jgi:imidazolonepropionase-like amidohydrolase
MTTGGYLDPWLPSVSTFDMFPAHPGRPDGICDGVDGVRKKVREVIRAGADVVKLGATGGVFGAADPLFIQFTPAELAAIVEESHLRQRRVMSHTVGTQGVKNAVEAGIESIEHGFYLDDEVVEMMAARGTYLVPTLMASDLMLKNAEANPALSEAERDSFRAIFQAHADSIFKAYRGGVRIAMGTDEGVMPHGHSLDELGLMCKIGMQPMDIIQSASRIAAGNLGWEDRLGTVEPRKLADLVVSKVNPITQITELADVENIALVIKDGKIVKDRRAQPA